MKRIAVLCVVLVCLAMVPCAHAGAGAGAGVRMMVPELELRGVVTWIDWELDEVIVAAEDGTVWSFLGAEEWTLFDTCILTIRTNQATDIKQWEVVQVEYTGWINPFEM